MTIDHVAAGDCERCRPGVVAQPVNTMSSLALTAAGWLAVRRAGSSAHPHRRGEAVIGWSAVAAGLGSVAYHGPGGRLGRQFHDGSLVALLAAVAVADAALVARRPVPTGVAWVVPAVGLVASRPRWSPMAQGLAGVAAVASEVARTRRGGNPDDGRPSLAAVVAGLGAVTHVLGRTGGPWCRPDSVLQPHALWHTAMAATLALRTMDVGAPRPVGSPVDLVLVTDGDGGAEPGPMY